MKTSLLSIAVYALTSILVLPRATAAETNPANLKDALLSYTWTWNKFKDHSKINFQEDGSLFVPKDGKHKWSISGPQAVRITYPDGTTGTLTFDESFKTYTNSHKIDGARLERREALSHDPKNGAATANSVPSQAPENQIEELSERKNTITVEHALTSYKWEWVSNGVKEGEVQFEANGKFKTPTSATIFEWKATEPRAFTVHTKKAGTSSFTFNENLTEFRGHIKPKWDVVATRLGPIAPGAPGAPVNPVAKAQVNRIEELIERKSAIVEDIFGPLDKPVPTSMREYIADLRENLLDEGAKKPVASSKAYDLGSRFCNALISSFDEREALAARLRNNAAGHLAGKPTTVKDHPNWIDYQRERAEAMAATHDNKLETAFSKNNKLQWSQRAEQLRKALDASYALFRQAAREPATAKQ